MSTSFQSLKRNSLSLSVVAALGGLALVSTGAQAAAPAAGTLIKNAAVATYTENGSTTTLKSNEVETKVLQVGSFTLEANRTAKANQNAEVVMQHILTNTGNGTDTFTLTIADVLTGDNWDFQSVAVYLDTDGNGTADGKPLTATDKITLEAGKSMNLVVVVKTPQAVAAASEGKLTLTAESEKTVGAGKTVVNTDTVTIITGASFSVLKSVNVQAIDTSATAQTVTYDLKYKNNGNGTANLVIEDTLDSKLALVAASVTLDGTALALWNGTGTAPSTSYYQVLGQKLTFTLVNVAFGKNGIVSFKVDVAKGTAPGDIANIAKYDSDGPDSSGGFNPDDPTNNTIVTVKGNHNGFISDSSKIADGKGGWTDNITLASVTAGSLIDFGSGTESTTAVDNGTDLEVIYIHNSGNTTDTFKVETLASTFPTGTKFSFYNAYGNALTSSVGQGVDTGPLAPGANFKLLVRVELPSGIEKTTASDVKVNITSVADSTKTDTLTLEIQAITKNAVDLSNGSGGHNNIKDETPNAGEGPYVPADVINTASTNPGVTVKFPIAVTNHGAKPEEYLFSTVVKTTGGTPVDLTDWVVEYFKESTQDGTSCSGTPVTRTGSVQPTTTISDKTEYYCVKVTPPKGQDAGLYDVIFSVTSSAGVTDSMKDQVTVNAVRELVLTEDQHGTVYPGGVVRYEHTLTNNGNVTEGAGNGTDESYFQVGISHNVNNGFTTTVYVDTDKDGLFDSSKDKAYSRSSDEWIQALQKGESVKLWAIVQAPGTATNGLTDESVIKITTVGGIKGVSVPKVVFNTDTTTVAAGILDLYKTQAAWPTCAAPMPTTGSTAGLEAKPGECVVYFITAENRGDQVVKDVQIKDVIPSYTTLKAPATLPAAFSNTAGTSKGQFNYDAGSTRDLITDKFDLAPKEAAVLKFAVQVDK